MLKITREIGALVAAFWLLVNLLISTTCTHCLDPLQEARCLSCIKNVTSLMGIDVTKRCEGYYCGQYQLSYSYWAESGKPGNNQGARDYEKCARDKNCAEQAVKAYFKKFKKDCNSDGIIDCHDMAALHKAGPVSCTSDWFYKSRYWQAFNRTTCVTNRDQPNEIIRMELEEQDRQPMREMKNQSLSQDCLDCICDAVSGCNTSLNNCGSGALCGPFAISQTYWKDGRKPGASWTACARTKECSMVTVKNYMEKNKRDCNGDGFITCDDYAAIHRRGPHACTNRDLFKDHYWNKFQACRANQKPKKDVNMVKVNEDSDDISASNLNSLTNRDDGAVITTPAFDPSIISTKYIASTTVSTTTTTTTSTTTTTTTSTTTTTPAPPMATTNYASIMESYQIQQHSFKPFVHQHHVDPPNVATNHESNQAMDMPQSEGPSASTTETLPVTSTTTSLRRIETASPTTVSDQQPPIEAAEYPLPEFPFAIGLEPDRANSFDRVATGIFASPDFTNSYPPMPEILVPEKPPTVEQVPSSSPVDSSAGQSKLPGQQRPSTHHLPPSSRVSPFQIPSLPISSRPPSDHNSSKQSSSQPKAPMHNQRSPSNALQQQQIDRAQSQPIDQSMTNLNQSIFGTDSMNISNLFEKGLNESSRIASECLECICDASSNCDTTVQCISKQREKNRCGLYMISWNQYQDSDVSLTSLVSAPAGISDESLDERLYYECTTDRACAEKLIHLYIEKHQKDCNNDGKIDCYDIAAIHRVGPDSCNSGKFLSSQYWKDFNICYSASQTAATTTATTAATTPTTISDNRSQQRQQQSASS